jgi:hypothetical protein
MAQVEKKWISTIKGELLPYLVKKQFAKPKLVEMEGPGMTPISLDDGGEFVGFPPGPSVTTYVPLE